MRRRFNRSWGFSIQYTHVHQGLRYNVEYPVRQLTTLQDEWGRSDRFVSVHDALNGHLHFLLDRYIMGQ